MIKKLLPKKKDPKEKLPSRITNDTVAEHREQVLAGGRKLKYPMQYTRRKLVRNTIIISVAALIILASLVWAQLYVWKDTSDLAYRITKTIPLPIARIDGESVRYSDYLLYHRSTLAGLSNQMKGEGTVDGDRIKFQQQRALDQALEDAYARKIAREHKIEVSDKLIDELLSQPRKEYGISDSAYASAVSDSLNWTVEEMHQAMKNAQTRREASFVVDTKASKTSEEVTSMLSSGKNLEEIAELIGDDVEYQTEITVPRNNSDGGLSLAAAKIDVGKTSGATKIASGGGYYFINRLGGDDKNISYSYIKVPLKTFKENFAKLKNSATKVYIKIERAG